MKKIVLIVLVVLAILMLPLLGGSMIWMLGGAHGLDINGTAQTINRPAESTSVGDGWEYYGGDAGGNRYSKLDHINPGNVANLSVAWI
jgi:quinoprotein glucose dehydrogenase